MERKVADSPTPERETFTNPFTELAKEIMAFIRQRDLISSIDLGVWLYMGNAESQLSAFLMKRLASAAQP